MLTIVVKEQTHGALPFNNVLLIEVNAQNQTQNHVLDQTVTRKYALNLKSFAMVYAKLHGIVAQVKVDNGLQSIWYAVIRMKSFLMVHAVTHFPTVLAAMLSLDTNGIS